MKRFWSKLRQFFCRHDMEMAVDWHPGEACIYIGCPKCGKIAGHFHLPTSGSGTHRRLH